VVRAGVAQLAVEKRHVETEPVELAAIFEPQRAAPGRGLAERAPKSHPGVPETFREDTAWSRVLRRTDIGAIEDPEPPGLTGHERLERLTVDSRQVVEADRRRSPCPARTGQRDRDRGAEPDVRHRVR